jgi:hypothetical protein
MLKISGTQPVFMEIKDTQSQFGKKNIQLSMEKEQLDTQSVRSSITPLAGIQSKNNQKFLLPLPQMQRNASI